MQNPKCTSNEMEDAGRITSLPGSDTMWYAECGCKEWRHEFEYSSENYDDALNRLEAHRYPNETGSNDE